MIVKKIVNLSDEEFEKLMNAGSVLKAVNEGLNNGEIDELSEKDEKLIRALMQVGQSVLGKKEAAAE